MRQIFILLSLCLSIWIHGQSRNKGIIDDPDGYTNVRSGRGTDFEIVGKILENELFVYYDSADENWLKVSITKCRCEQRDGSYYDLTGYVHRSRILNAKKLTRARQKQLLNTTFKEEKRLYERIINANDRKSNEYRTFGIEMRVFHDYQFVPVLDLFEQYICEFKDRELLEEYLKLLEVEEGSADEIPAYTLGSIFECDPDWMFESMTNHLDLMNLLEWGIVNIGYDANLKEPSELTQRYNELRVSIGLSKTDFSIYFE